MTIDPKDPTDIDVFGWDFTAKMEPGDELDSGKPVIVSSSPGDIIVVSGPTFDIPTNSIYAKLGGGQAGVLYQVSCTASTIQGETYKRSMTFLVTPL